MKLPKTDKLIKLIAQYGVQCSETKELAPTTEFAAMFKEIEQMEQQLILATPSGPKPPPRAPGWPEEVG